MIYQIPIPDYTNFEQRISLDGATYIIQIRWNDRESKWYMNFMDANREVISAWRKMVTNTYLLTGDIDDRLPPGRLAIVGESDNCLDPLIGELGPSKRVYFMYLDADSVVAS